MVQAFLSAFSMEHVVLEPSNILEILRDEFSFLAFRSVVFHLAFIIRTVAQDVETRPLGFTTDEIANKVSTIFLIHFTDFTRSINLNRWIRYYIDGSFVQFISIHFETNIILLTELQLKRSYND